MVLWQKLSGELSQFLSQGNAERIFGTRVSFNFVRPTIGTGSHVRAQIGRSLATMRQHTYHRSVQQVYTAQRILLPSSCGALRSYTGRVCYVLLSTTPKHHESVSFLVSLGKSTRAGSSPAESSLHVRHGDRLGETCSLY